MKLFFFIAAGVMAGLVLLPFAPLIGLAALGVGMMGAGPWVQEAVTNAFSPKCNLPDRPDTTRQNIDAFYYQCRDRSKDPPSRGVMQ